MIRTLLAFAALAVGLTSVAGAQQAAAPLPTIRIAMPPVDAASQAYYAQAKGFFKKAGLNVEIQTVSGGAPVAAAVVGGAADIGQSNLSSLCSAHERGIPIVAIAGANLFDARTRQSELMVAANSPYHVAKDLNGKIIGVAGLKNVTEVAFDAWMEANGADYKSAKVVEVPFSSMADAVATGRIDAAMMTEPELSGALAGKRVRILSSPMEAIARQFVIGAWFSTAAYAKAHPDIIKAFASAMAMSADWANHNQVESGKILEAATGIASVGTASRVTFANRLEARDMQPLIDASAKYGALKTTFPAVQLMASAQ
jgi:NitT/TauT family transport system substrate-binding protein